MIRIRSDEALVALRRRARLVPAASTLAASALAMLPIVTSTLLMPPTGLLMLMAWRLLRPELWSAWVALPLGLADDLLTGAPIGSAPVLWTCCLLALDRAEGGLVPRSYAQELLVAAALIALFLCGEQMIAVVTGGGAGLALLIPRYLITLSAFPAAMRIAAALDRWRLGL